IGTLASANFIDASSLFARRAWEQAGGFDRSAGMYADWDLWLGIVERGWRIAYVPEMLYRYRIHESSSLRTAADGSLERFDRYVREKHSAFRPGRGPAEAMRRIIAGVRSMRERAVLERDTEGPTKLVLVGARRDGQAGVVLDTIADGLPYQVVAFLDETVGLWGTRVEGIPVYGEPWNHLARAVEQGATAAMVSIGHGAARERLAAPLLEGGLELVSLVHPRSYVAPSARLGADVFVGAMCGIGAHARLGDHVMLQGNAYVGHDSVLDVAVTLAPGVAIGGRARVGDRAFLGLGAVILPDVSVGEDAVVGAGAVVRTDVPAGVTVAGVPAKPIER
ncbi:MAG: NeuD/PglB/VioB family sugar acetyltransferase, partial [Actinomycetota bacterium]